MRTARIKADGAGYYHCMSRVIEGRYIFRKQEKEKFRNKYIYLMFDVSQFMKPLKQRFSRYYNKKVGRRGPLWEQRFKSILVENSQGALSTMAAYIDLNCIRVRMVSDPKDYRYCGYGEATNSVSSALPAPAQCATVSGMDYLSRRSRESRRRMHHAGPAAGGDCRPAGDLIESRGRQISSIPRPESAHNRPILRIPRHCKPSSHRQTMILALPAPPTRAEPSETATSSLADR